MEVYINIYLSETLGSLNAEFPDIIYLKNEKQQNATT